MYIIVSALTVLCSKGAKAPSLPPNKTYVIASSDQIEITDTWFHIFFLKSSHVWRGTLFTKLHLSVIIFLKYGGVTFEFFTHLKNNRTGYNLDVTNAHLPPSSGGFSCGWFIKMCTCTLSTDTKKSCYLSEYCIWA